MVIWSPLEASCPICSRRLRLRLVGSGFATGQDSDLLVRMKARHIIQAEVHTCPCCRFSGCADDFLVSLPPGAAHRFVREVSPRLADEPRPVGEADGHDGTPLPDVQYFWAYRTAEALGIPSLGQGERLLRAYWCLRLPPSADLPQEVKESRKRLYLTSAIRKLRQGLAASGEPNLLYLIGELCRRNGNFRLAAGYFRSFLEGKPGARYLKHAAGKLLQMAGDKLSQELSMEEVLFDTAPDPGS